MTNIECLESRVLFSTDMVIQWNDVVIDVLRADTTLPGPTWASRTLAMVHAAIFDAVNGIDGSYRSFLVTERAPRGANIDAAIASAAHAVLLALYPQQQVTLDAALTSSLAHVRDGAGETRGVQWGQFVAQQMLLSRTNDGSEVQYDWVPDGQTGHWEPDPLNPTQTALSPLWGDVEPFSLESGDQFYPPHVPELSSAEYTAALNEVKSLGALDSTTRTAEQTQIGLFWAYDRTGLGTPLVLYNQIVQEIAQQQRNSVIENARLFALTSIAQADSGIAAWESKYVEDFWRPISGIRRADEDGNPDTIADPDWTPLGAPGGGQVPDFTPPFPAYVSGHATFGAATFAVLREFYGTDRMPFTLTSDELPGVSRSYTSFSQAAAENGRSRIYLGIHWSFDDIEGQALGNEIADWVVDHVAQPSRPRHVTHSHFDQAGVFSDAALASTQELIGDVSAESGLADLVSV